MITLLFKNRKFLNDSIFFDFFSFEVSFTFFIYLYSSILLKLVCERHIRYD